MVMGIACHLATDTYAHRTVIDMGDITAKIAEIESVIGNTPYTNLKTSINKYRVEFRDLKQYATNKDKRDDVTKGFEDNISIYPSRYNVASKSAVHGLYYRFMTKETAFGHGDTIITDVFAASTFEHKINNLALYASADNTINDTIEKKSTLVYRYDPQKSYEGKQNDIGYTDYSWSSNDSSYTNTSLRRYS